MRLFVILQNCVFPECGLLTILYVEFNDVFVRLEYFKFPEHEPEVTIHMAGAEDFKETCLCRERLRVYNIPSPPDSLDIRYLIKCKTWKTVVGQIVSLQEWTYCKLLGGKKQVEALLPPIILWCRIAGC